MSAEVVAASEEQLARAAIKYKGKEGARAFTSGEHCLAFVAEQGMEIVGWCWGYHLVRPDGRSMVYLHELEVDPGVRRQRYGTRLFQAMLAQARILDAEKLFLITEHSNEPARHLYESSGALLLDDGETVVYWWRTDQTSGG